MNPPQALCISSWVAWGSVGNAVVAPVLAALGVAPLAVPTVVLSNHPGLGAPAGQRIGDGEFAAMLERLEASAALERCRGILTGYFVSPAQVASAAAFVRRLKQRDPSILYLCDPVIGDDGGLYVAEAVASAIRDLLLPHADVATPNRFELAWLTGREVSDRETTVRAAQALGSAESIVTSVPEPGDRLGLVRVTQTAAEVIAWERHRHVPRGTGDLFAALYLACRCRGSSGGEAFALAAAQLKAAIDANLGAAVIDVPALVRSLAAGLR
jgi:pyridoxine kinase